MSDQESNVYLHEGALEQLDTLLAKLAIQRILFVVDKDAYALSGAEQHLASTLAKIEVASFSDFANNPQIEDVQRGVEIYRQSRPDAIVALGGGTAIDLAKLISVLSTHDSPRDAVLANVPVSRTASRLIVIPTTAGTGSEATHFAVVYVDGKKYSIADASLVPDVAIVDPLLTHSLPAALTCSTGLDAFCQAVESIWAVGATDASVDDACESLRLSTQYLVPAIHHPTPQARLAMCRAAHLAGRAINVSKTTASHALSYPLTSYFNIPHGKAVAMTLPAALAFNAQVSDSDCCDPRGAQHVLQRIDKLVDLFDAANVSDAYKRITAMIEATGSAASLHAAGIVDPSQRQRIIDGMNAQRMSNNPRKVTPQALQQLLS